VTNRYILILSAWNSAKSMPNIHVVTDSGAHFVNPFFVQQHPITVVPNRIQIAGRTYREGVDLSSDEAIRLIAREAVAPSVTSPSEADFAQVYTRLAAECDAIISIHPSRHLYPSLENARAAAEQIGGHCEVIVIDSQSISAGQAMLVRLAAEAAIQGASVDEVVRTVRGAVERVYGVFYVESVSLLLQNKLISSSHAVLGTMLGIKPFLAMENGYLTPMEKVRTRTQAVERLVEFVVEFTDIDDVVILQNRPHLSDQTRAIQDRLAVEFAGRQFPYAQYGPSLAALIGADAMGVVILETELDEIDDDF
jgi:DegV family protein with EDD domain